MKLAGWWVLCLAIVWTAPALAQDNYGGPSSQALGAGGRRQHQNSSAPAEPHAQPMTLTVQPDPWPRLDPGAVLCRSPADLARFNALREARLSGQPPPDQEAADCTLIRAATPITIITRDGPARTEVKLSRGTDETGWTDAYLPSKAPAARPTP
jgi:hypothetical protein